MGLTLHGAYPLNASVMEEMMIIHWNRLCQIFKEEVMDIPGVRSNLPSTQVLITAYLPYQTISNDIWVYGSN